jgi:hypothetical protein
MTNTLRRTRDLLAVFVVVLVLSFLAGAPTAAYDLPAAFNSVSEPEPTGDAPVVDDEALMTVWGIDPSFLVLIAALAIGVIWAARTVLIVRDRGPPSAVVTVSTATLLGA